MASFDLVVVGSGPGGSAAALAAGRRGLRVAVIERAQLGGVCLNVGCIPTKALIAVARTLRRIRQADALGLRVEPPSLDYPAVFARSQRIIAQGRQGLLGLLRQVGVEVLNGAARFEGARQLRVTKDDGSELIGFERAVVAAGASPSPGPWAFDGRTLVSYKELLTTPSLPSSLLIIGGGVIGCEFASCFAEFGVRITLIEQQAQLLPNEDPEAVRLITQALQRRGVEVIVRASVAALEPGRDGVRAVLDDGRELVASQALIAIGLRPNSTGLGLEALGISTAGGIAVDDHLLTSQPHVAAIGDCLAGHGLAHLASTEGQVAVHNLSEQAVDRLDRRLVPRCVFTDPEMAQVGVTEPQAEPSARVSRFSFAALGKSLCEEEPEGFVKMLVDPSTDRVLGVTIVGQHASSLIHLGVLAMQHGLTATQLTHTVTAHPTWPEAFTEAAAQFSGASLFTKGYVRSPRAIRRGSDLSPPSGSIQ